MKGRKEREDGVLGVKGGSTMPAMPQPLGGGFFASGFFSSGTGAIE